MPAPLVANLITNRSWRWDVAFFSDRLNLRQLAALKVHAVNVGDVVVLKSGGPRMTVTEVGREKATCEWFDDKRALQHSLFILGALSPVPEDMGESKNTQSSDYDPFK